MKSPTVALGSLLAAVIIFLGSANPALADPTVIRLQLYQPPTHTWTKTIRSLAPLVEEMSGGRAIMKVYDSSVLAKQKDFLEACQKGIVDIADWYPMRNAKAMPVLNISASLPLIFNNITSAQHTWDDPELISIIQKALEEKGYNNVGVGPFMNVGFYYLGFTEKEVKVPSDLKGLKIMARGDPAMNYFEGFGASCVSTLSSSEVYEALTRGVIDGTWGVTTNWIDWKWGEPVEYFLNFPIIAVHLGWVWNKSKIDKLPDDLKAIVKTWLAMVTNRLTLITFEKTETYFEEMRKIMKFYTPTAEEMALWIEPRQKVVDDYLKVAGEAGKKAMAIVKKHNP